MYVEVRHEYNNKTPLDAKNPSNVGNWWTEFTAMWSNNNKWMVVDKTLSERRIKLFDVFIQRLNYVGNHHIHGCVL